MTQQQCHQVEIKVGAHCVSLSSITLIKRVISRVLLSSMPGLDDERCFISQSKDLGPEIIIAIASVFPEINHISRNMSSAP